MQNEEIQTIDIRIFGKDLKIKCDKSEISALEEAVDYVDRQMRVMRNEKVAIASIENIAIITALNIAHELFVSKTCNHEVVEIIDVATKNRIINLRNKIELALEEKY